MFFLYCFVFFVCRLLALAVLLAANNDLLHLCESGYLFHLYYVGTLLLLSIVLILCIAIIYVSAHGRIMYEEARASLPYLLYGRTILLLPDLVLTAVGTKWAFHDEASTNCPTDAVVVVRTFVIISWLMQLIFIILIFWYFDPRGRDDLSSRSFTEHSWKTRFAFLSWLHDQLKVKGFGTLLFSIAQLT